MRLRYGKWTAIEIETVIGLIGVIAFVICGLMLGFGSSEALGIAVGTFGAMVFFYSMAVSLETTLDMGVAGAAKKHSIKMQLLRYGAVALAAVLISKTESVDVVIALLTLLFSIKVATYVQPLIHRLFCGWFGLKDEFNPDALYLPEEDDRGNEEYDGDEDKPDRIDRWMDRLYKK